jgi:uncharacterized membrane protein YhaH (DUF805 family)
MKWLLDALKNKYATFEGRARRKEYWHADFTFSARSCRASP